MSAPAFAAVQNVKVSGDIDSWYVNRDHFNLGVRNSSGAGLAGIETGLVDQSAFLTQTRVRIDADLSDNVSTTVGIINERAWQVETVSTTDIDLYLAYATMREFLYSPLTLSVGRQVFSYGNGLVMGDGGVNNLATGALATVAQDFTKRTSYDGIKAILDYKPLTIDLLYFKNDQTIVTGNPNSKETSSDVYGFNANYQLGDEMNTVLEGYLFTRFGGDAYASAQKGDVLYVPGLRVSTNPVKGLNAQAEVAWQGGRIGNSVSSPVSPTGGDNSQRQAWAAQFMTSYTLPMEEKYKPTVNASYTHLSGDKNYTDNRPSAPPASRTTHTAWDPFNEAQGSGTIYNTLFNLTNMNIVSAGVSFAPVEDVSVAATWSGLWADKRWDSSQNPLVLVSPDGNGVTPSVTSSKKMGNEYDVNVNYAYTEDVTFGVSLGWFVPGKTFDGTNDTTASQALAHVLVNF